MMFDRQIRRAQQKPLSPGLGRSISKLFGIAVCCVSLLACTGGNVSDLQSYVAEVKSRKKGSVPPLPEPEHYESYAYVKEKLRDPFTPKKKKRVNAGTKIKLQCRPPRDILEGFPLDSLKMVGSLEQKGERWALVKGNDGTLYRTKKGKCMGQDDGKIMKITESEIVLMETVADGLGGRIKRKTVLSVSE